MNTTEIWKPTKHEGYSVSNLGNIRDDHSGLLVPITQEPKIGRRKVYLGSSHAHPMVATLVAEAFCEKNGKTLCFLNGNFQDPRAENLALLDPPRSTPYARQLRQALQAEDRRVYEDKLEQQRIRAIEETLRTKEAQRRIDAYGNCDVCGCKLLDHHKWCSNRCARMSSLKFEYSHHLKRLEKSTLDFIPQNEQGVVFLFARHLEQLGFDSIIKIGRPYPDCVALRQGLAIAVEFEFKSHNFVEHAHDPKNCDLIVCWEHNWKDCPLPVLVLKDVFSGPGVVPSAVISYQDVSNKRVHSSTTPGESLILNSLPGACQD